MITKEDIIKALKKEFWNGKFIELHSGDLDTLIKVIQTLTNNTDDN